MIPSVFDRSNQFHLFDDFLSVPPTTAWAQTKGTGGTIAVETGATILDLPTAASANDYVLIAPPTAVVGAAQKKTLEFEVRFKYTEANTNNLIFAFGLSSVLTTGFMQNTTSGPPASFNGAVFYKVSGDNLLRFRSSAATVNTDNAAFATLVSGTTYTLGFTVDLNDATTAFIIPTINSRMSLTSTTVRQDQVRQGVAYAGWTALFPFAAVRAGSASAETLSVDYISLIGVR